MAVDVLKSRLDSFQPTERIRNVSHSIFNVVLVLLINVYTDSNSMTYAVVCEVIDGIQQN